MVAMYKFQTVFHNMVKIKFTQGEKPGYKLRDQDSIYSSPQNPSLLLVFIFSLTAMPRETSDQNMEFENGRWKSVMSPITPIWVVVCCANV